MKTLSLMMLFGLVMSYSSCSSYVPCSCHYKCEAINNCQYGVVKDTCGCCEICAKGVGEACGGLRNIHGICAGNLECIYPPSLSNTERLVKGGFCTGYE
uniref:Orphan peptide AbOp-5 n=1 Tax=Androctonus bicolor TaxID=748906 RepID=A0A0K0LC27_9SCOR|nr:orphan peptide AbOp-5 [Androctonus bicolor]